MKLKVWKWLSRGFGRRHKKTEKGFVWIEFIFTKIKNWNWKHYSEIIFKCVNSVVRPIFNKKVTENWNLWDPWTVYPCTVHSWLGQIVWLEQKKTWFSKCRRANVESKWVRNSEIILNVWIIPWDPFLMKKWLKSGICKTYK